MCLRGRLAPGIFHVLSPVDIDVLTSGFFSLETCDGFFSFSV